MPGRIGDLSKPWVCPPSLVKVFAKRHAVQAAREAKRLGGAPGRALTDAEFYRAVQAAARRSHP